MPNWYGGIEGLYSRLEKAVADLAESKNAKQTGLSWLNYLSKHSDVPKAEMDATGLVKYLTDNKGKTLQTGDLTQYLEANRLPIGETRLGEKTPLPPMTEKEASRAAELGYDPRSYDFPQTQYEQWQLKGPKQNYREFLYHDANAGKMPNPEYLRLSREEDALHTELQRPGLSDLDRYHIQQTLDDVRSNLFGENPVIPKPGSYQAPHFDDMGNGLAFHSRASDRMIGNRQVRHVDELQSDWAQSARDKGTYDPAEPWEVFDMQTGKVLSRHPDATAAEVESEQRFARRRAWMGDIDSPGEMPPMADFAHAAQDDTGRVPTTPWAGEQQGIPFYTRAAMNRQIYDAAKSGKEGVTWTTGQQQVERYPGMENPAGMSQFYDQKLPKDVAREVRRLGYDPEQLIGKTELPGEMPNAKLLMDAVSHRGASPLYNQDVYKSENDMGGWIWNVRDAISQTHGSDAAHEALMPLIRGWEQGMPHEEWRQQAADTYQNLLKTVAPRKQSVWQLDLSDPALREKIVREGLPIMSLGTLGGKALYDQAQMNPLSALNPGVPDDGY
jgi:hypothetical protein